MVCVRNLRILFNSSVVSCERLVPPYGKKVKLKHEKRMKIDNLKTAIFIAKIILALKIKII